MNYLKSIAPNILRIGLALVMLWFGFTQCMGPASWVGVLPEWTSSLPISQITFVYLNGWMEMCAGLLLILGLFTRFVSAILAIHLIGIVFSLGYNAIAVRDFGLVIALISIFMNGEDSWSLDKYLTKNVPLV